MRKFLNYKNFAFILLICMLTLALCACGNEAADITQSSSPAVRSSSPAISSESENSVETKSSSENESSEISAIETEQSNKTINDEVTDSDTAAIYSNADAEDTAASIPGNWISAESEPDLPDIEFIEESSDSTPSSPWHQLSDERKKEILDAYGKYFIQARGWDLNSFWPEYWESQPNILRYCIDSYDGNNVVIIYNYVDEISVSSTYTVGSYTFNFRTAGSILSESPQLFIYYNNSEIIELSDAYDRGIVSDEMLEDIYNKFEKYYNQAQ